MMFELAPNEALHLGLAHEYVGAAAHDSDPTPTYGYIYSHMKRHQRVTSLLLLKPGADSIEGVPFSDMDHARAFATNTGVVLVKSGVLDDMVYERRANQMVVTHYELPPLPLAVLHERLSALAAALAETGDDDTADYQRVTQWAKLTGELLVIRRAEDGVTK